jgi:amino acid adenylation domain-containing protein/FkbM family methyltransferase
MSAHSDGHPGRDLSPVKLAALAHRARRQGGPAADLLREPLAITGLAVRLPGGESFADFERLVLEGRCAIGPLPDDRWDPAVYGRLRTPDGHPLPAAGGFLGDVRGFDAAFFRMSGREADALDPQHRLLLELAFEALETSGEAPGRLAGSATGIWIGLTAHDYADRWLMAADRMPITAHFGTGNQSAFAAGRLAYLLGVAGPAVTVDTACSSGLVALAEAAVALRAGRVDRALVGAAHLILSPGGFVYGAMVGTLAPDGISKAFADGADGFGRGEGGVVLVLERLSDAISAGRLIWALVRSVAVGQDGASGGLTVPNGPAQSAVIRVALAEAGLDADAIDLIEAHGTGTDLGDPVELLALAEVFARPGSAPLPVGSVKSAIGHLEAAAGLAGLAKAAVAVRASRIPPTLHCSRPTRRIEWPEVGLTPARAGDGPVRRVGVSSFGLSGTNAHAIVEAPPEDPVPLDRPSWSRLPLLMAGATRTALAERLLRQASRLATNEETDWRADLCQTTSRAALRAPFRIALALPSTGDAAAPVRAAAARLKEASDPAPQSRSRPKVGFLFAGQGGAPPSGFLQAVSRLPAAADRMAFAREVLGPVLDRDLFELLGAHADALTDTRYAQPVLAALGWALAGWWETLGVAPSAVVGHSLGELPAAAVCGLIAPEAMLRFATERGRLMAECPPGAMLLVAAAESDGAVRGLLDQCADLEVAGRNGPRATVLAGPRDVIDHASQVLGDAGLSTRRLAVTRAFHSALMDPCLAAIRSSGDQLAPGPGGARFFSTVTGAELPPGAALDGSYWARQAREPVAFADSVRAMEASGCALLIEVGAVPLLAPMAAQLVRKASVVAAPVTGDGALEAGAGQVWAAGVDLDTTALYRPYRFRRVLQPGPVFERRPHWLEDSGMSGLSKCDVDDGPPSFEPAPAAPATEGLDEVVVTLVAEALGIDRRRLSPHAELLELGADSLALVEIGRLVKARFGVTLAARDFFDGCHTMGALTAHIGAEVARKPPEPASEPMLPPPRPVDTAAQGPAGAACLTPAGAGDEVATLFRHQLDLVRDIIDRQASFLEARAAGKRSAADAADPRVVSQPPDAARTLAVSGSDEERAHRPGAEAPARAAQKDLARDRSREPQGAPVRPLAPRQRAHLESLIKHYVARTATSKRQAEAARERLADSRASAGFRLSIKEMLYPIVGQRADGARLWDVDGNVYIDISMNFGAALLGHRHPEIEEALRRALSDGLAMAPRSPHMAGAAERLCRLTRMERVVFLQSGTEAVMTAVRLARLATGRDRIALFLRSYHGHADTLLAMPGKESNGPAEPIAPGTPASVVGDVTVLPYGSTATLETLRTLAPKLAAVLVEPVQSRDIANQPRAFLQKLRELTRANGTVLIFDEMITGFRLAPGGAQEWFGVEADLACYGKALGGGIAIGAVAGRHGLLDGVDGGLWSYGDASRPERPTTFVAGTFNGNPLAMAAADATLAFMERKGPELQRQINGHTQALAERLNQWLRDRGVDLDLVTAGSLFRFRHAGNLDLLYYHLLAAGVFVWEGKNCFLSAAHGAGEVHEVASAVEQAVEALEDGGFLDPVPSNRTPAGPLPGFRAGAGARSEERMLEPSLAQQHLWLLAARGDRSAAAYVETLAMEVEGSFDLDELSRAVRQLPERHEALRAAFDTDGRQLRVAPSATLELTVDVADPAEDRSAWLARQSAQPIRPDAAPAARVVWRQESGRRGILLIAAHHALVDGWSLTLLVADLFRLLTDRDAPPPAAQLGNVLLDGRRRRRERAAELESYWQSVLDPPIPLPSLPTDRTEGPPVRRVRREVEGVVRAGVERLGRRCRATPFAAFLGVAAIVLHRWTGEERLAIGCPVLGRGDDPALREAVAYATHLMPVVSAFDLDRPLLEAVADVRDSLLAALDHQDMPYAELAERHLPRDCRGSAGGLVALTFNLDRPFQPPAPPGLTVRLVDAPPAGAKFPICVNLLDLGDRLVLDIDADGGRFSEGAVVALAEMLLAAYAAAEDAAERPAAQLPMADEAAVARLQQMATGPRRVWSEQGLVPARIDTACRAFTDRVAIEGPEGSCTYAELEARSAALAARLQAAGLRAGERVAVFADRSILLPAMLVAILRVGGVFVPLSVDDPLERLSALLADSDARLCLAEQGTLAAHRIAAAELPCPILPVSSAELGAADVTGLAPPGLRGDHAAYLLYTSGSTGQPKGVLCRHDGLANRLAWMDEMLGLSEDDRVLQKTPYTFDVSLWEFLWPLTKGATLVVAPPGLHQDPQGLAAFIAARGITHVHFVPSMLSLFLSVPDATACRALRALITSGEELLPEHVAAYRERGLPGRFWNFYGPTEASIDVTAWEVTADGPALPMVPIGRPVANTTVRILEPDRTPCPIGVAGEIWLGGVQLAEGYVNRPQETRAAFIEDAVRLGERLYRTGDLGRWLADGAIAYLGRRDGQVKLAGHRVELGEIEARLAAVDGVREAAVAVLGDGDGRHLAAFLTTDPPAPVGLPLLPDGAPLATLNAGESAFLIEENWIEQVYLRHGVGLGDGAVVVDVGANVGVFASAVATALPRATVVAVEPAPVAADVLSANASRLAGRIRVERAALGDRAGRATLRLRERLSLLSSLEDADAADSSMVGDFLMALGENVAEEPGADEMLEHLLSSRPVDVPMMTASDLIARHGLARIDLLKIDVEGAEEGVVAGVAEADWTPIQQVVIEVHDVDGRLNRLSSQLGRRGFNVVAESLSWSRRNRLVMLYARRPEAAGGSRLPLTVPAVELAADRAKRIRSKLARRLPPALIPHRYFALRALPLSRHGKLDRAALPELVPAPVTAPVPQSAATMPLRDENERVVAEAMATVLGRPVEARDADFFQLGGQSLQAARLVQDLRLRTGRALAIGSVFDRPTPAGLAALLALAPALPAGEIASGAPRRVNRTTRTRKIDELEITS